MARRAKEREEADWPIFQGYLAGCGTEGMNWVRGGIRKKGGSGIRKDPMFGQNRRCCTSPEPDRSRANGHRHLDNLRGEVMTVSR